MKKSILIKIFIVTWLLVPAAAFAFHFGQGEYYQARDRAGSVITEAEALKNQEDWLAAADKYAEAIKELPIENVNEKKRLELEQAKARMRGGEILEGMDQIDAIIAEIETPEDQQETELLAAARHEFGMASYYSAWIMRVEGATEQEWKPEVERARQQFRLLAEEAETSPVSAIDADTHKENLEAAIRLEQMDLSELRAKPLPKNCNCNCNGKSLSQQKRKQAQSRQGKGKGQGEGDARQEVQESQGAGLSERDGSGS